MITAAIPNNKIALTSTTVPFILLSRLSKSLVGEEEKEYQLCRDCDYIIHSQSHATSWSCAYTGTENHYQPELNKWPFNLLETLEKSNRLKERVRPRVFFFSLLYSLCTQTSSYHSGELLHIMLHENVHGVPAKKWPIKLISSKSMHQQIYYPKDFVNFLVPTGLSLQDRGSSILTQLF